MHSRRMAPGFGALRIGRQSSTAYDHDSMPTIIGLAGSERRASFNAALLRAAIQVAPASSVFDKDGNVVDEPVRKQLAEFVIQSAA